jgi:hypothetical protein
MSDARLAFLLRCAAKFELVEACVEDIDQAIDDMEIALHQIRPCPCECRILASFERLDLKIREELLRNWRWKIPR